MKIYNFSTAIIKRNRYTKLDGNGNIPNLKPNLTLFMDNLAMITNAMSHTSSRLVVVSFQPKIILWMHAMKSYFMIMC